MSILPTFESDEYEDGRTKQAFKDQTDINKILARAQREGSIAHLVKHGAEYGDFTDMPDLLEAQSRLQRGQAIFDELPSEVRKEFGQSPAAFFTFVNDPKNADRLHEVIPDLARPGRQLPDPSGRTPPPEPAVATAPAAADKTEPSGGSQEA